MLNMLYCIDKFHFDMCYRRDGRRRSVEDPMEFHLVLAERSVGVDGIETDVADGYVLVEEVDFDDLEE